MTISGYDDHDIDKNHEDVEHNMPTSKKSKLDEVEDIYSWKPEDIETFRKVNTYLDPYIALKKDKITFLRIVDSKLEPNKIKEKFNQYLNVKYNHITNPATYKQNMDKFIRQSRIVTKFLEDVLEISGLQPDMRKIFEEEDALKKNPNLYELMILYRSSKNRRLKFEILRKVGLVDIVSRIEKTFPMEHTDFVTKEIEKLFSIGLGLKKHESNRAFMWIDENDSMRFSHDEKEAREEYERSSRIRKSRGLYNFPLQSIDYTTHKTHYDKMINILQIRNKLRKNKEPYYTSFMEKMIRKNIEFPNQIHDTIGARVVVKDQAEIPDCIRMLEKFMGGSSSRKKEKDKIHKFGKEKLNPYSSNDYYVWKAIYDIALPNYAVKHLLDLKRSIKDRNIKNMIAKKIEDVRKNPVNSIIEVQIQDLESYLLSITKGSSTEHSKLKMNEIRQNSFYKLFPAEIYKKEIEKYKGRKGGDRKKLI
ncbi:MAG: hypothetical protein ACLFTR_00410 [Candidatus Woesearchaeota archaeon]